MTETGTVAGGLSVEAVTALGTTGGKFTYTVEPNYNLTSVEMSEMRLKRILSQFFSVISKLYFILCM